MADPSEWTVEERDPTFFIEFKHHLNTRSNVCRGMTGVVGADGEINRVIMTEERRILIPPHERENADAIKEEEAHIVAEHLRSVKKKMVSTHVLFVLVICAVVVAVAGVAVGIATLVLFLGHGHDSAETTTDHTHVVETKYQQTLFQPFLPVTTVPDASLNYVLANPDLLLGIDTGDCLRLTYVFQLMGVGDTAEISIVHSTGTATLLPIPYVVPLDKTRVEVYLSRTSATQLDFRMYIYHYQSGTINQWLTIQSMPGSVSPILFTEPWTIGPDKSAGDMQIQFVHVEYLPVNV